MLQRPQQKIEGASATSTKRPVELYIEVENVNEYTIAFAPLSEGLRTADGSVVGGPDLHRDGSIRIPHLVLSDRGRGEAASRR